MADPLKKYLLDTMLSQSAAQRMALFILKDTDEYSVSSNIAYVLAQSLNISVAEAALKLEEAADGDMIEKLVCDTSGKAVITMGEGILKACIEECLKLEEKKCEDFGYAAAVRELTARLGLCREAEKLSLSFSQRKICGILWQGLHMLEWRRISLVQAQSYLAYLMNGLERCRIENRENGKILKAALRVTENIGCRLNG